MEHFLTKKVQPIWLLRLVEGLLIPPLLVWLAAACTSSLTHTSTR